MRYFDLRNLKRAIFILVLIGVTLIYIQLKTLNDWSKFIHLRVRISRTIYYESGRGFEYLEDENTPDMLYNDLENNGKGNDYTVVADDNKKLDNGSTSNTTQTKKRTRRDFYVTINLDKIIADKTDFIKKPLMVLFSSWIFSPEKANVQSVVSRLWNAWPSIKPLVLTSDTLVQKECTRAGWRAQNVSSTDAECNGPPVLSKMFTDVSKKYKAHFYGFSNADIIFGDGLEKTMSFLYYHYSPWKTKPVLVVGRRHNVDFIKHANFTLASPANVSRMTEKGTLVKRSTDFFFSNDRFPWERAPKVSIGRPFVIRAIIGWALQRGFHVIDATKTIESVHLTTEDGILASWHKNGTMCNRGVLANWKIPLSFGHCECARLETFKGANKTIQMRHRPMSRHICGR